VVANGVSAVSLPHLRSSQPNDLRLIIEQPNLEDEAAFAWQARSRATCRLSTLFTLFDRELSFMDQPPTIPTVLQPPEWHGLLRAVAASQRQSQPIDPEMFGTKTPRTFGTTNIQPFRWFPPRLPLSFFPS
jgi:hypothetical protein